MIIKFVVLFFAISLAQQAPVRKTFRITFTTWLVDTATTTPLAHHPSYMTGRVKLVVHPPPGTRYSHDPYHPWGALATASAGDSGTFTLSSDVSFASSVSGGRCSPMEWSMLSSGPTTPLPPALFLDAPGWGEQHRSGSSTPISPARSFTSTPPPSVVPPSAHRTVLIRNLPFKNIDASALVQRYVVGLAGLRDVDVASCEVGLGHHVFVQFATPLHAEAFRSYFERNDVFVRQDGSIHVGVGAREAARQRFRTTGRPRNEGCVFVEYARHESHIVHDGHLHH